MTAALLQLSGRYAVGQHAYALVDEDLFQELSRFKWKAKPNARRTHVYAVRNVVVEGVNKTIRLHRHVLGYFGPLDVDHIDRNTMNNQRSNLRVATRSENVRNAIRPPRMRRVAAKPAKVPKAKPLCTCMHCGLDFQGVKVSQLFCGQSCRKKAKRIRQARAGCLPPSQRPRSGGAIGSSGEISRKGNANLDFTLVASLS